MSKGIGRQWRMGLVAAAVVAAGLATASGAGAVTVDLVGDPHSSHSLVGIGNWEFGERNDITVKPSGFVLADETLDRAFPFVPASVVVTDRTTPLRVGLGNCVQLDPHSIRCASPFGIASVEAQLGDAPSGSSFELVPGRSGYQTPMLYSIDTRDGPDRIKIPTTRGTLMWTMGGNDTLDVNDPSGVWGDHIHTEAGDDDVRLTTNNAWGTLDCGDGVDTAFLVSTRMTPTNCETVTPGP